MAGTAAGTVGLERRNGATRPWSGRDGRPVLAPLSLCEFVAALDPELDTSRVGDAMLLSITLPPGRWEPPDSLRHPQRFCVVMSGALLRSPAGGPELILAWETIRISRDPLERWSIVSAHCAELMLVTAPVAEGLARVPGVLHAIMLAGVRQAEWNRELRSIVAIKRVEERIASFFEHLARRIGRPEGERVRIPLLLGQRRIEELLGTGHTQASQAFRSLFVSGALIHDASGWTLAPELLRSRAPLAESSVPNALPAL